MNYKKIATMIGIILLIILMITFDKYNTQIDFETNNFWVCMDGCSNMQDIIHTPEWNYKNWEEAKELHDECANVCCKQYMPTLGCDIK